MFLEIEAGLVLLAIALALMAPNLGSRWLDALKRTFGMMAERYPKRTQAFLAQNFPISTDAFRGTAG